MQNTNLIEYSQRILQNIERLKLEDSALKQMQTIDYIEVFSTIHKDGITEIQDTELAIDSIAKDLLMKENKLLKSKCEKWQMQNRSLELLNDKLQVKLDHQNYNNSNGTVYHDAVNLSMEKTEKYCKCLKAEIDSYKDIINKIQIHNNHNELKELRNILDDSVSKTSELKQELLLEKSNSNLLFEYKCKLLSELCESKSLVLNLNSKINVMRDEIQELQTKNNDVVDNYQRIQGEILSERNTISKLTSALILSEESSKATNESLKSSELIRKQIMQSYTNEINELKATITALQCEIKKLENNEKLVNNKQAIVKPNKQLQHQDHDTKQITINNVKELNTSIRVDQTTNHKLIETVRVCPGCHETAYGLMIKCHHCSKEYHMVCSRKIKNSQPPFLCESCLQNTSTK